MTTITRDRLEGLPHRPAWFSRPPRTPSCGRHSFPSCPAWCWVDHDAEAQQPARTYVGEGDDAPLHASPWVTFGTDQPRPVEVRLCSLPSAKDGSGATVVEIQGTEGSGADIPLRLAEVAGPYLLAVTRD